MAALTEMILAEPAVPRKQHTLAGARLRKHADYQRVYRSSRKYFSPCTTYFFRLRTQEEKALSGPGPRVGLTVGRVMGNAVTRNRMKRRLREAVRLHLPVLSADVDLVLHPKKLVGTMEFSALAQDIEKVLGAVEQLAARPSSSATAGKQDGKPDEKQDGKRLGERRGKQR